VGALTLDPPSSRWVGTKFTRLCPCSRWTPLGAGRVGIGCRRKLPVAGGHLQPGVMVMALRGVPRNPRIPPRIAAPFACRPYGVDQITLPAASNRNNLDTSAPTTSVARGLPAASARSSIDNSAPTNSISRGTPFSSNRRSVGPSGPISSAARFRPSSSTRTSRRTRTSSATARPSFISASSCSNVVSRSSVVIFAFVNLLLGGGPLKPVI